MQQDKRADTGNSRRRCENRLLYSSCDRRKFQDPNFGVRFITSVCTSQARAHCLLRPTIGIPSPDWFVEQRQHSNHCYSKSSIFFFFFRFTALFSLSFFAFAFNWIYRRLKVKGKDRFWGVENIVFEMTEI
ncbi:hypothetical protein TNCV_2718391 [Trichonephila clavipes]|nr:hypothetical protein TNCV_2718391 [Trichonephila clavipes]